MTSGKCPHPWNTGKKGNLGTHWKIRDTSKMKGKKPWNTGKKDYHVHTKEFIEKQKQRMIGNQLTKGMKLPPRSKEHIQKIKEWRATKVYPKKDTSIEVKIQNYLKQINIDFFTHQYMRIEHGYQCDIFIPSRNLVIECDGDYWHSYPTGREIDYIRTSELTAKGFKVLRLWETEIKAIDLNKFKERIDNV